MGLIQAFDSFCGRYTMCGAVAIDEFICFKCRNAVGERNVRGKREGGEVVAVSDEILGRQRDHARAAGPGA